MFRHTDECCEQDLTGIFCRHKAGMPSLAADLRSDSASFHLANYCDLSMAAWSGLEPSYTLPNSDCQYPVQVEVARACGWTRAHTSV
eukprot:6485152-Amphidinium_carterae.1